MQKFNFRDVIIPIALIGIVGSVLVPLPTVLLDFLLVGNLILSLGLFVTSLQIADPLKLSSLPTILLLSTLYRLCLNISTTRLILGDGAAGETVEAFGSLVVGGNIGVGLIVFCVLTFIQFLVVAKGSERVAEVAARFTLDAMPGKQMSIDADVRAGLYDLQTARGKRSELQTESRFYGALDGAMKFVKGDAIAGIVIVLINLCGGFMIGMISHNLSFAEALHRYTLLTIGDGLASQIPSLLNSLAAGLVVTRVVKTEGVTLSTELWGQLVQSRMVLLFAGLVSMLLSFVPAMPFVPLFSIGVMLLVICHMRRDSKPVAVPSHVSVFAPRPLSLLSISIPKDVECNLSEVLASIDAARQKIYEDTGLLILRPAIDVGAKGSLDTCHIHIRGVPVREVSSKNLSPQALADSLVDTVRAHQVECIDDSHTRRLLDFFESDAPELVSNVVPHVVSLTQLTEVLRGLLRERVSIRSLDLILQSVSESAPRVGTERVLLEEVRVGLGRIICGANSRSSNRLEVLALDPVLDLSLVKAERERAPLDTYLLASVLRDIKAHSTDVDAVLVSKGARRLLSECFEMHGIVLPVIAHEEVCADVVIVEKALISCVEKERYALAEKIAA